MFSKFSRFYNKIKMIWLILCVPMLVGYSITLMLAITALHEIHINYPLLFNHHYLNIPNLELGITIFGPFGLIYIICGTLALVNTNFVEKVK